MTSYTAVAPPGTTPVSRAEARLHCRVDDAVTEDDALIDRVIAAATAYLDGPDGVLGRALVHQTWRIALAGPEPGGVLRLPLAPVEQIDAVEVWGSDGVQTAFAGWRLVKDRRGAWLELQSGESWPGNDGRSLPVEVEGVFGYGAAVDDVPEDIRQAVLLMVGHFYEHREQVMAAAVPAALPFGVQDLIARYRRGPV